jgi:peptidoglycan/xylan/chitin deacetylase (PgdA/CDA1 family)
MNRRQFAKALGMCAVSLGAGQLALSSADEKQPQVAMTMDDFRWLDTPKMTAEECNGAILSALREENDLKAALFVVGKYVESERGKALLSEWDKAGHIIANHSYSHLYYNSNRVTFDAYAADFLRGDEMVKDYSHFTKLYRFPFLKEGNTAEKRDRFRALLKQHGYRNGHVTIDASDWAIEDRLRKRLAKEAAADLAPYRDFYLSHMWDRALYYDGLSRQVLGRSVRHTLLVHFNLLNALFLGDLMRMFKSKGWQLIAASKAFQDPVFSSAPKILPAGESLIWALAKETGRFDKLLRYPGEDGEYENEQMDKLGL